MIGSLSGLLAFMAINNDANKVFNWFVNLVAVGGLMIYIIIAITYLRFRAALDAQGIDRRNLPFRSPFARAGAWIALIFIPSEYSNVAMPLGRLADLSCRPLLWLDGVPRHEQVRHRHLRDQYVE